MPHKHKRRGNDDKSYDLPPSMIAKSLPTRDPTKANGKDGKPQPQKKNGKKGNANQSHDARPKKKVEDDTPRAFRYLMQLQQKGKPTHTKPDESTENKKRKRNAGDDKESAQASRKKKPAADSISEEQATKAAESQMKILPGEKLSDFAARVDREMPLSAMKKSGKANLDGLPKIREERQTKHERHLRRLQRMWREDDVKIKEREAAERDEREEEMEDQLELWKEWETEAGKARAKKKNGKGGNDGGKKDADPWAKLNKKERLNKPSNPFDVAQAPPELKKPKAPFKVRGGAKVDVANVPTAVGSLRRREELAGERRNIVEEYRRLMAEKRQ